MTAAREAEADRLAAEAAAKAREDAEALRRKQAALRDHRKHEAETLLRAHDAITAASYDWLHCSDALHILDCMSKGSIRISKNGDCKSFSLSSALVIDKGFDSVRRILASSRKTVCA